MLRGLAVAARAFQFNSRIQDLILKIQSMAGKRFEELEVWSKAREFCVLVYRTTNDSNFKDFGLKDQLRRAAISTISNIAEGFERNGNKELIQFLSIAKGSAGEIRAQLYIAKDLEYITGTQFAELSEKITDISKMISGFINYIKKSEFKGTKFVKEPENFEL
jgi:four helix bundle protein